MNTTHHENHEDFGSRQQDAPDPRGVFGLLQGIFEDVKMLAGQQVKLAIHELQMEGARAVSILVTAIITGILGALCLLFLLLTAVAALHEVAGLAIWMSCGVIALILIIAAGGSLLYFKSQAQRFKIVPARSLHVVKEDARWIKERIASSRT